MLTYKWFSPCLCVVADFWQGGVLFSLFLLLLIDSCWLHAFFHNYHYYALFMGVARIFFGEGTLFENFPKNLLRKLRIMHYFNIWNFEKIFENFQKFLEKIAKMYYFNIFFKKVNKPWVHFLCVWTENTICWKFLRKFSYEIAKNALFLHIFQKNLTNHALIFRAFGRKTHCWEILRNFRKIS